MMETKGHCAIKYECKHEIHRRTQVHTTGAQGHTHRSLGRLLVEVAHV